jgi:hypothetical protein
MANYNNAQDETWILGLTICMRKKYITNTSFNYPASQIIPNSLAEHYTEALIARNI